MSSRKKSKAAKIWHRIIIALFLVLLLAVLGFVALWRPASIDESVRIYIPEGSTFESVMDSIEVHHASSSMVLLRSVLRGVSYPKHIKTGSYVVTPEMGILGLAFKLYRGNQDPIKLVVGKVRTLDQLAALIDDQLSMSADTLLCLLNNDSVCAVYGMTPQTIIALFPQNSYEFYWNISPSALLKRMKKEYDMFWNSHRLRQCETMGMSPIDVTTLASIVEEETNKNDEKENVASVYLNRLRRNMPLQADPTVKYASGNFALRRITTRVLCIQSPYNTYLNKGLPPGPICIPSHYSIDAVLKNRQTNYFFFCAREDFSGYHRFASTLAEHSRNAARYHRELNARGIK